MDRQAVVRELLAAARELTGANHPSITGDRREDADIWSEIEDAIYDLMQDALESGRRDIDKSGARKAIRDIAQQHGADKKDVDHYFWEEYHNTEWPE